MLDVLKLYRRVSSPVDLSTPNASGSLGQHSHLITVGLGEKYRRSAERLAKQAEASGWFKGVYCLDEESSQFGFKDIISELDAFRRQYPRGYGLWSWKPYLIKRVMNEIPEGDRVYYVDAGCEISKFGRNRFAEIDRLVEQHGGIFFELPFLEREWSNPGLCDFFNVSSDRKQVQATWFGLKVCPKSRELAMNWWGYSSNNGFSFLIDEKTGDGQGLFRAHRHDQSILSCVLSKLGGGHILPWEDHFAPRLYVRNSWILLEPIHTLRNSSTTSILERMERGATMESILRTFRGEDLSFKIRVFISLVVERANYVYLFLKSKVRSLLI